MGRSFVMARATLATAGGCGSRAVGVHGVDVTDLLGG
jgi:hypothetical protein